MMRYEVSGFAQGSCVQPGGAKGPAASRPVAAAASLVTLPTIAYAATIGGNYYAPQYDNRESFAATDGKNFVVIPAGDTLPGVDPRTGISKLNTFVGAPANGEAPLFTTEVHRLAKVATRFCFSP